MRRNTDAKRFDQVVGVPWQNHHTRSKHNPQYQMHLLLAMQDNQMQTTNSAQIISVPHPTNGRLSQTDRLTSGSRPPPLPSPKSAVVADSAPGAPGALPPPPPAAALAHAPPSIELPPAGPPAAPCAVVAAASALAFAAAALPGLSHAGARMSLALPPAGRAGRGGSGLMCGSSGFTP